MGPSTLQVLSAFQDLASTSLKSETMSQPTLSLPQAALAVASLLLTDYPLSASLSFSDVSTDLHISQLFKDFWPSLCSTTPWEEKGEKIKFMRSVIHP